ncbi:TonB-dependent receptor [Pelagicoccus sp. NFK12]|uniref:TonB-dependent receptor n=1 Tax=Pelagicoccus enzymogenes TaxID=2773457 RepID=A0A927FBB1_9BACT|nr:TonB-dependent receptor [Pelagicoccus enzymogenes]MBD5780575.1 TonB-dependent receptor [Pelagicoccus enzymogenes]MDQ8199024.1 TonB-dependent receptor [Pelagicoccus enzymogenes]
MMSYQEPTLGTALLRASRAAFKYVPLFILSVAMVATGFAQSTGSIRGQVKNATTGKLVYNAVVTIEETGRETKTDEYGVYRFSNVPSGEYTITADYVGMRGKPVSVTVDSGVSSSGDILLVSRRAAQEVDEEEIFELAAFEVDGSENYDANAMALNEQRRSDNLVVVQDADAFGEIAEGNIGEYLKNLPGVSVEYVAADVRSIKLRGMSSAYTQVTVDGSQMASAGSGNAIRRFELEQVSLANVDQLQVYKLPLPDMSANSIGGSVNLVSKNAFAMGKTFSYKASLNVNSDYSITGKSPGWPSDVERSKTLPNFELAYSDVFMDDRLGLAVTYKQSNMANPQKRFRWRDWQEKPDGGNGDVDDIYYTRLQLQDGPKKTSRESFSANLDYKINDNTMFSLKGQLNFYDSTFINRNTDWGLGDITQDDIDNGDFPAYTGAPTGEISNLSYAFGESNRISHGASYRGKFGNTYHIDANVKQHLGEWTIDYGASVSEATNHYRTADRGFMIYGLAERIDNEYVEFDMTEGPLAAFNDFTVFDSDMNPLPNRGRIYEQTELRQVWDQPKDSVDIISGFRVNAKRNFTFGENQGFFKFGVRTSRQHREAAEFRLRWEYNGYNEDGQQLWMDQFVDNVFKDQVIDFGYEGFDWPSGSQLYDYFNANRDQFDFEESTAVNHTISRYYEFDEDINAAYAMAKFEFLDNKFSVLAGVRYEETSASGLMPVRGSANNYVNSRTDYFYERVQASDSYDSFHPSVHIKYDVNDKLLLRLSYANTIGRADFGSMFGVTEFNAPQYDNGLDPSDPGYELNDPDTTMGRVSVRNPGLLPRESDNIDLTAEYYYDETGFFGMSFFQNDMTNFIQTQTRELTADDLTTWGLPDFVFGRTAVTQADIDNYGLDPEDLNGGFDYEISVPTNVASAKIQGMEVNWRQDLNMFGDVFKGSSIYANGTFLSTDAEVGDASPYANDLPDFIKQTYNYGYLFERGPWDFKLRWNIQGPEIAGSRTFEVNGAEQRAGLYRLERTSIDADFGYKINDRISFFANARNINNAPFRRGYRIENAAGSLQTVLEIEERFGIQYLFGVKGKF